LLLTQPLINFKLSLLGNLPSSAFTGILEDNNIDGEVATADEVASSQQQQQQRKSMPPSSIGGNSSAMYNLRHDID
jgi:hypothetical protein